MGIYRALDSGPLEAWFVDTVHLTEPGADVDQALAAQGTIVGVAIAGGSLASGGLILWHPFADYSAIAFPIVVSIAFAVVHLVLTLTLVHEPRAGVSEATRVRQALDSAKDTPKVIGDGLNLLRHNRILAGLVGVELFWVIGMIVFESMLPIRLAEMLGSTTDAGALLGPSGRRRVGRVRARLRRSPAGSCGGGESCEPRSPHGSSTVSARPSWASCSVRSAWSAPTS